MIRAYRSLRLIVVDRSGSSEDTPEQQKHDLFCDVAAVEVLEKDIRVVCHSPSRSGNWPLVVGDKRSVSEKEERRCG